jgi:hypothetical protein
LLQIDDVVAANKEAGDRKNRAMRPQRREEKVYGVRAKKEKCYRAVGIEQMK